MNSAFAHALQSSMQEQGMSQKQLAIAAGLSKAAISQYINGVSAPRGEAVEARRPSARRENCPAIARGICGVPKKISPR
jgi:transcriptional regulator with XRE-family HTH domain